jgi:hypothetical protein
LKGERNGRGVVAIRFTDEQLPVEEKGESRAIR